MHVGLFAAKIQGSRPQALVEAYTFSSDETEYVVLDSSSPGSGGGDDPDIVFKYPIIVKDLTSDGEITKTIEISDLIDEEAMLAMPCDALELWGSYPEDAASSEPAKATAATLPVNWEDESSQILLQTMHILRK